MQKVIVISLLILGGSLAIGCNLQSPKKFSNIETDDIGHFWQAFDSLRSAHNYEDSLRIMQQVYLDRMTEYGKKYIIARKYTAIGFIKALRKYPRFYEQLRLKTADMDKYRPDIDTAFKAINALVPDYKVPDVCFAIGYFNGGGTISKNKDAVLIGCEIALADSMMDVSEFTGTLRRMFTHANGRVGPLIAHESVHCQEWNGQNNTLLSIALAEGAADFLANEAFHIHDKPTDYTTVHECELWQEFKPQLDSEDVSQWFYNSSPTETRPADLGYFMGRRICQSYYKNQKDKRAAIKFMLDRGNYRQVFAQSGYNGNCGN